MALPPTPGFSVGTRQIPLTNNNLTASAEWRVHGTYIFGGRGDSKVLLAKPISWDSRQLAMVKSSEESSLNVSMGNRVTATRSSLTKGRS